MTSDIREALIPLTLIQNTAGDTKHVEAVIDTGFTDRLILPPDIVDELELPLRGSVDVVLADGGIETLPMYQVRLVWHDQERTIWAYAASGDPLVGMALLSGSELRIRATENGAVDIEELS